MNPETLAFCMYRRSRISLPELMNMSQELILRMYLTARISLLEFKTLMALMEGKAKSKKKRVRKRAKTDDKQADAAQ